MFPIKFTLNFLFLCVLLANTFKFVSSKNDKEIGLHCYDNVAESKVDPDDLIMLKEPVKKKCKVGRICVNMDVDLKVKEKKSSFHIQRCSAFGNAENLCGVLEKTLEEMINNTVSKNDLHCKAQVRYCLTDMCNTKAGGGGEGSVGKDVGIALGILLLLIILGLLLCYFVFYRDTQNTNQSSNKNNNSRNKKERKKKKSVISKFHEYHDLEDGNNSNNSDQKEESLDSTGHSRRRAPS